MNIKMEKCVCGFFSGEIRITMGGYRRTGAKVVCAHCGRETAVYSISETHITEKSISTPYTEDALIRGVNQALAEWNRRDNAEHCVVCDDVIPEGRQVCPKCEKSV